MKKLLITLAVMLAFASCRKDNPEPDNGNTATEYTEQNFYFTPYQMAPMKDGAKSTAIASVCSRLDLYIIDTAAADTIRIHQDRTADPTTFGNASATLQTNHHYRLIAIAHNSTDTATLSAGIISFPGDIIKQTLVADTIFTPADGLSLTIQMPRIVGMFKLRIADPIPETVTHFDFAIDSSYTHWNLTTATGHNLTHRSHTITSPTTATDGTTTMNIYIIPDNLTATRHVTVTASALTANNQPVETRQFPAAPIRAGYVTTYTGTFFITFDMGLSLTAGDWLDNGTYNF